MKPADPAQAEITAFNGRAQVIIRSKAGQPGKGRVEIAAEGLPPSQIHVTTQ